MYYAFSKFQLLVLRCLMLFLENETLKTTKRSSWVTAGVLVSRDKLKIYNSISINTQNEEFKVDFRRYTQPYKRVIKASKA